MLEQYLAMSTEFHFHVIDGNQAIEAQQTVVRDLLASKIDLARFGRQPIARKK
jgi:hypothetical protein